MTTKVCVIKTNHQRGAVDYKLELGGNVSIAITFKQAEEIITNLCLKFQDSYKPANKDYVEEYFF